MLHLCTQVYFYTGSKLMWKNLLLIEFKLNHCKLFTMFSPLISQDNVLNDHVVNMVKTKTELTAVLIYNIHQTEDKDLKQTLRIN